MKCPKCKKGEMLMYIEGDFESGTLILGGGSAGSTGRIETKYRCYICGKEINRYCGGL